MKKISKKLAEFIEKSPTVYQAVENTAQILEEAGYKYISEGEEWNLQKGCKFYTTRNGSSLIAARVPEKDFERFMITAAHGDSPTFRVKENPEIKTEGYTKLNVEKYGGMICSTWLDKMLSVAGRIVYKEDSGAIKTKNVNVDEDLCIIPNVAIHMERHVNDGKSFNPNVDMMPIICQNDTKIIDYLSKYSGLSKKNILSTEIYLYNRQKPSIWGKEQYISAPRLDDLQCAFGCLQGFIDSADCKQEDTQNASVFCLFDNEEVGSGTKQGADSTFLEDVLYRICESLSAEGTKIGSEYRRKISNSFMISADNAHAVHPNHPELSDKNDRPKMNKGIVVKYNASQKYSTDAVSCAIFEEICRENEVPCQHFTNRADMPGGSTLGNISNAHVSLRTVDIGLSQLAMHSSYETAGNRDTEYLIKGICAFYNARI